MLGLGPSSAAQGPLLIGAALSLLASIGVLCWPLRDSDQRTRVKEKLKHPQAWLAEALDPSHVVILGLVIALCGAFWLVRTPPQAVAKNDSAKTEETGTRTADVSYASLRRPYFGRSKDIFDENLTTISQLLNGRGVDALKKAEQVTATMSVHPVAVQWRRYENVEATLRDIKAALEQINSVIFVRMMTEYRDQALDLNDILQSSNSLTNFSRGIDRAAASFFNFKDIFERSANDEVVRERASGLFADGRELLIKDMDDFKTWINECNRRIDMKRKALG
jgi:hypothetical protein